MAVDVLQTGVVRLQQIVDESGGEEPSRSNHQEPQSLGQDPELLGLHHVHMRCPNPDEIFTWLLAKYGGERAKMKGRIDGIKYSVPGFSTVWILAQRGDAEPSENHAIDHIGWRSAGTLTKTIDGLRAQRG